MHTCAANDAITARCSDPAGAIASACTVTAVRVWVRLGKACEGVRFAQYCASESIERVDIMPRTETLKHRPAISDQLLGLPSGKTTLVVGLPVVGSLLRPYCAGPFGNQLDRPAWPWCVHGGWRDAVRRDVQRGRSRRVVAGHGVCLVRQFWLICPAII